MSTSRHKARIIKRAPKFDITYFTFETPEFHARLEARFDERQGSRTLFFKRLWESDEWEPKPYEIPRRGIIPALKVFDPEAGFIVVSDTVVTDKFISEIHVQYV